MSNESREDAIKSGLARGVEGKSSPQNFMDEVFSSEADRTAARESWAAGLQVHAQSEAMAKVLEDARARSASDSSYSSDDSSSSSSSSASSGGSSSGGGVLGTVITLVFGLPGVMAVLVVVGWIFSVIFSGNSASDTRPAPSATAPRSGTWPNPAAPAPQLAPPVVAPSAPARTEPPNDYDSAMNRRLEASAPPPYIAPRSLPPGGYAGTSSRSVQPAPRPPMPFIPEPQNFPLLQGKIMNLDATGRPTIIWSDGPVEVWGDNGVMHYILDPGGRMRFPNSRIIHAMPRSSAATKLFVVPDLD